MKPVHMPVLKGKDAKRFIEQDTKPLSSEQKEYLKTCQETYEKKPIKQIFIDFDKIEIKKLDISQDICNFDCNLDDDLGCNDFIHNDALLYQKERQGITYLFFYNDKIVGYATLIMSSLSAENLTAKHKKIISLKTYPSLLIGRLAVDNSQRGNGIGKYICNWCSGLAIKFSNEIGCRYIILETTKEKVEFYKKCNFEEGKELKDKKRKLIWMYQRITTE